MSEHKLTDDSLQAIKERALWSITWVDAEFAAVQATRPSHVPAAIGDALWRAVRDRRLLLDLLEETRSEPRVAEPVTTSVTVNPGDEADSST